MEARIKEFVKVESDYGFDYGYGAGSGSGYVSGSGYGSGDGSGSGSGFGDGCGSGYGYGYGFGDGDGYGSVFGYGDDSGFGSGDGFGEGYGYGFGDGSRNIKTFNNQQVNRIDGIPTIITNLKGNIAKGFILNEDFTLSPCFVIKHDNLFAHGETLHEARQALESKLFDDMDVEEKIEMFLKEFKRNKKYKGTVFFDWHNRLTGSCELGRKTFVKNKNLSLKSEYTVDEFIELTKDEYGGEVIRTLKKRWKES